MRLSAELINSLAEQRTNPLGERELVLRGLAIPAIEHLATTRDAFDTIDFTDNRLQRLENFPRLLRLSCLNCSGNILESFDTANMGKNIPNITNLNLSYNNVASLAEVSNIATACTKLEFLNLHGNPVTRRQHYRLYVIKKIPTLRVLDFTKISKSERDRADRLANSAAGAALESDVQGEARSSTAAGGAKTFVPGEGRSAEESFVTNFTPQQKDMIRQMIANASSPAEIEEIERSVKRGIFPTIAGSDQSALKRPPPTSSEELNGHSNNGQIAKKSRVESEDG